MYRKLIDLKKTLQADKHQLEIEISGLKEIIDKPDPQEFDEFAAASRIRSAKSTDHLEGSKTANKVIKQVDKERITLTKELKLDLPVLKLFTY